MSGLDRDALDRWITGGRYESEIVEVTCKACADNDIETRWLDTLESEYGASWLNEHEQCPKCGADYDSLDIDTANREDYDPRYEYDPMEDDRRQWKNERDQD